MGRADEIMAGKFQLEDPDTVRKFRVWDSKRKQ